MKLRRLETMLLSEVLKKDMKGVFYGRHSTDRQNMDSQLNSASQLVKKYGCFIIKPYLDPGISAAKIPLKDRPGLQELLKDAKEKKFDFIVVQNNDRLARDPIEHLTIRLTLRELGIPIVVSATEKLYDSRNEDISQLLQDGFSKYEVENIKLRTMDGLKNRARSGKFTGGNPPFGYRYIKEDKRFDPYPEELEHVKNIFDLYKKGDGLEAVASKLPSGSNKGKDWTKEKVRTILTNPFYAGFISWGKRSNSSKTSINDKDVWILTPSDYIKPVITKEEWELCWQIFNSRRKKQVSPKQLKTSYLLTDLLICKTCKNKMKGKDERTSIKHGKKYGEKVYKCETCSIKFPAKKLQDRVINSILNDVRTLKIHQIYEKISSSLKQEVIQLKKDLQDLETALGDYAIKQSKVKIRLQDIMKSKLDKNLIGALTVFNQEINNRIRQTEDLIKQKQNEIQLKDDAEYNREAWNVVLNQVLVDRSEIEPIDIRRLLLPLVKKLLITPNGEVEYYLRIDTQKRHVTDQLVF